MPQTLSALGFVFAIIAGYFLWVTLGMDTASPDAPEIANLQAMQIQIGNLMIGLTTGLMSAVFFVGAAIVSAILGPSQGSSDS